MSFFEEPLNRLGGPLPLALVLASNDRAAIVLQQGLVYREGMTLTVETISPDQDLLDAQFRVDRWSNEPPDELMRFGVEYADGRKATALPVGVQPDEEQSVGLLPKGGGGGFGRSTWQYWLWPLPTEDPFSFVCQWPAANIPLTRTAFATAAIVVAANESRELRFGGPSQ